MNEFPNHDSSNPSSSDGADLWGQDGYPSSQQGGFPPPLPQAEIWGMAQNTYLMLMHLSQFLGVIFPGLGLVVPIIMWAVNKDAHPEVDAQGRIILNWIISGFLYCVASIVLCFVLIGFLLVIALLIVGIVFPILGAVKANDGVRWKYPLSIPFFKVGDF